MKKRSTKSISFLMEFIIVIFFFALSSAVCVHIYAQAQALNDSANHTKEAMLIAQNYIATFDGEVKTIHLNEDDTKAYVLTSVQSKAPYEYKVEITLDEKTLVTLPFVYKGGDYEK